MILPGSCVYREVEPAKTRLAEFAASGSHIHYARCKSLDACNHSGM